ncbi:MAG: hypothetical protein NTW96_23630 [Planctomycetia bacterium]|nr:hypothetical protein [Planctomycetia bacterium]
MKESEKARLRAWAESKAQEIRDRLAAMPVPGVGGEAEKGYAKELERLTDSEAIEHLRSVDESRVVAAYLILSKRLDPNVLADVCLDLLARDGEKSRLTGAIGVGSCLKGTLDARASRALALTVRNRREGIDIRRAAYASLLLVNHGPRPAQREEGFEPGEPDSALEGVDWGFVDSFIP